MFFYEKVLLIYHSIKLPFDEEVAKQFLNVIYSLGMYGRAVGRSENPRLSVVMWWA